jgi:CRP/FNR family transcriptional regulator, cyclic AMP receptor protein
MSAVFSRPAGRRPFFDELTEGTQQLVTAAGRARRFRAHTIVFFEHDEAANVLVLKSGLVKLSVVVSEREVMLDVLGPGDLLGEVSAIQGSERSATATALTAVDAVSIPTATFMAQVPLHTDLSRALLLSVTDRLRNASRRQVEYGALDAVGRVCRRLVEMVDRFGAGDAAGVTLETPLTQSDIAAWAGLSREAVVKALHALRALGWIDTSPRICVRDVDAVRTRAAL